MDIVIYITIGYHMSKYYVYELWDPRSNEVFYVGKGSGSRAWSHERSARNTKNPTSHKQRRIKNILEENQSVIVKIVFETKDETAAFREEIDLIAKYGRADCKKGPLLNQTDGGEGGNTVKGQNDLNIKNRYLKRKETLRNKSIEEKELSSLRHSRGLKKAWQNNHESWKAAIQQGIAQRDKTTHGKAISNGWKQQTEIKKQITFENKSASRKKLLQSTEYAEKHKEILKCANNAVRIPIKVTLPSGEILIANSITDWCNRYCNVLNLNHGTTHNNLSKLLNGWTPKFASSKWNNWKVVRLN